MIDFADLIAVNKADRRGALDALRDVTKQFKRSRKIFDDKVEVPVFLTQASQFNDGGVNKLFFKLADMLDEKQKGRFVVDAAYKANILSAEEHGIISPDRQNYLAEIVTTVQKYKKRTETLAEEASKLGSLSKLAPMLGTPAETVQKVQAQLEAEFTAEELESLKNYDKLVERYSGDELVFQVRDKEIRQKLVRESLSGTKIRKVVVPKMKDWGDRFRYLKLENVPGEFPFTAGVGTSTTKCTLSQLEDVLRPIQSYA
jgi:methylmalonyl-CoA mutase